jgi:23S rRNA pseudouridine1911/1915/1917 synthase
MNIIYEDKNIIVVNKLAGVNVHPDATHKTGTLIQEILKTHPEIKNVGDPSTSSGQENLRPGIVHRLDKDTSGIMIIAKNQPTFEYLKNQFAEQTCLPAGRKIKKIYIALVEGELNPPAGGKTGVINLPIGRSKASPIKRLASSKARGKLREAITEYKVLEKFPGYTLVEASPKTGRTHQIRVHFKAIGHPVVCDKLYGQIKKCPAGLNRQFLHAFSLELTLADGSRSCFEADLADDLEKVLAGLRKEKKYDRN